MENWLKVILAALGTAATYLFGGWDAVLLALVTLVVLDYLTGLLGAWVEKRLDSNVGAKGIAKKVGYFVLVAMAAVIDRSAGLDAPILRTVVIWALIANEGISITENLGAIGVPVPGAIKDALEQLKNREAGGA